MPVSIVPIQRRSPLDKILPLAGGIVGGVLGAPGGPTGVIGGAGAGAALGAGAAGILGPRPAPPPLPTSAESGGMQRRFDQINSDPVRSIAQAQAAMQGLSPDQFPETRRAFDQAMAIAQRNQEMGRRG